VSSLHAAQQVSYQEKTDLIVLWLGKLSHAKMMVKLGPGPHSWFLGGARCSIPAKIQWIGLKVVAVEPKDLA